MKNQEKKSKSLIYPVFLGASIAVLALVLFFILRPDHTPLANTPADSLTTPQTSVTSHKGVGALSLNPTAMIAIWMVLKKEV